MSSSNKMPSHPPKWAERLLAWCCPKDSLEEVQGDLLELYDFWVETLGEKKARRKYILNAIRLQKPFAKLWTTASRHDRSLINNFSMGRSYVLIARRSLLKNRAYVAINAVGVGIAFACCLAAYLVVAYNVEFDNFHSNRRIANIFKVHTHLRYNDGTTSQQNVVPMALGSTAASAIAGIERITRYLHDGAYIRYRDKVFSEKVSFADSTFFEMFDFPFVEGDRNTFKSKSGIVLSEDMAKRYFGHDNAVGEVLTLNFPNGVELQVAVGGVLKKVPLNSTFVFDALMRIENLQDIYKLPINDWSDDRSPTTFMELTTPTSASAISAQLNNYIGIRNLDRKDATVTAHKLEHFKANFTQDDMDGGNTNLRSRNAVPIMFSSMAALILLIACFNLTNTTMAMTARRVKEIGVRKAMGAFRKQIILQFLTETTCTIILSLGIGLLLAQWIVPAFSAMWNVPFTLGDLDGVNLFGAIIGLAFLASLLAGLYPALINSKFKPVSLLKGEVKIKGTNGVTRTLVTFQFALSVVVLAGGVIFTQNADFQKTFDFGYDKEMLLMVNIRGGNELKALQNVLRSNPKILSFSAGEHNIGQSQPGNHRPVLVGLKEYSAQIAGIGENYFQTMGLELNEGRYLNTDNASDRDEGVIVNQAFVDQVNMKDPLDKSILVNQKKHHIVGVVKNHVDDVFIAGTPMPFVFYLANPDDYTMMMVKADVNNLSSVRKNTADVWKSLFPSRPFESQYQQDIVLADAQNVTGGFMKIFLFLAILGGILSISGIFSLAALNVARRTKEIGVRKVLGASLTDVIRIINKEFVIILLIAAITGSAGGYFATQWLLGAFNMIHVTVEGTTLLCCGLALFGLGVITTSLTILKAASASPVETLRSE